MKKQQIVKIKLSNGFSGEFVGDQLVFDNDFEEGVTVSDIQFSKGFSEEDLTIVNSTLIDKKDIN